MKLRAERRPKHADKSDSAARDLNAAYVAVGTIQHFPHGGDEIWRWKDEPGCWRDRQGRILPAERVKHIVPELAAELEQRALLEDRETVAGEVRRLLSRGNDKVVEERGEYTLRDRQGGGLIDICRNGVAIHPAPLPEPMARAILDTLAPPAPLPEPPTLADAVAAL